MKNILIIEDEAKIARFLELELNHEGYKTESVGDGRKGLDKALEKDYDLIILDLMLPELSGMEVCRRLRAVKTTPIIMLTARDETMDKVMGLDMGADDYMSKPFAIEELLARIRRIFKMSSQSNNGDEGEDKQFIKEGKVEIDLGRHEVRYDKELISLTKKEFDLLVYLVRNKEIVLSRDRILEAVWGFDYYGDTNVVDVYIRYLRIKLDEAFNCKLIHTVRGVGYTFKNEQ